MGLLDFLNYIRNWYYIVDNIYTFTGCKNNSLQKKFLQLSLSKYRVKIIDCNHFKYTCGCKKNIFIKANIQNIKGFKIYSCNFHSSHLKMTANKNKNNKIIIYYEIFFNNLASQAVTMEMNTDIHSAPHLWPCSILKRNKYLKTKHVDE